MNTIKVFEKGSKEYKKLELAAAMLELLSDNDTKYVVDETYFDFGQNWKWTTISIPERNVQVLYPPEQEQIVTAASIKDIVDAVEKVRADKYFPDK